MANNTHQALQDRSCEIRELREDLSDARRGWETSAAELREADQEIERLRQIITENRPSATKARQGKDHA